MNILNSSIMVRNLELRNRLVMPPMATAKAGNDGKVTEQLCQYYDEKSRGGYIGLIITEHSFISPEGKAGKGQISMASDSDIAGLSKVTEKYIETAQRLWHKSIMPEALPLKGLPASPLSAQVRSNLPECR